MSNYTFGKSNRLKSKQQIDQLFVEGNSFIEFPFKVVWRWVEDTDSSVQIALSVPKKKLTKAVHRNQIKRLIRESYRQKNQRLKSKVSEKVKQLHIMFIFLDTQLWHFQELDNKISVTLERLQKVI